MSQLTLDTIMERPQWVWFQSSNGLAAAAKLAYTYNKEADEDGWLSLPNAAFKKLLGPNWKKWLEKTVTAGCALAEVGEELTRWRPKPRFLTADPVSKPEAPVSQPRPRYPSDDRRRTGLRNDSAFAPQATPQGSVPGKSAEQPETPQPSVSDTVSETEILYKNALVSETVSETAANHSAPTPQRRKGNHKAHIEEWRKVNERLGNDSANVLDDCQSKGFHILVWNHARKIDKQNGNDALFRDVQAILLQLQQRQEQTGEGQGAAWFASVTEMFAAKGYPLPSKSPPPIATDHAEVSAFRAAMQQMYPDPVGDSL